MRPFFLIVFACAWIASPALLHAQTEGNRLDVVRSRHQLQCGVIGSIYGFSLPDSQGVMRGLDADSCRAVAAAVLGDANAVKYVLLPVQSRFTALQSGEVDVLYANVTWTFGRDVGLGISFTDITYYDGQGFLVRRSGGITQAGQLDGATICMLAGGTAEQNLGDYARAKGLHVTPVLLETGPDMSQAFLAGRCDAITQDASSLASLRSRLGPADYAILPEVISNEPLGGSVAKGDPRWFDIVRWTHYAMVAAEALGVTSHNVDALAASSTNPAIRRLLGREGALGQQLGLDDAWAGNVIRQVGNFGEMWDRDVAPTGVERGRNRIWTEGGLQYSPPIR